MTSNARQKCGNLRYAITYNVIWANQKTESFEVHWFMRTCNVCITSFSAMCRALDVISSSDNKLIVLHIWLMWGSIELLAEYMCTRNTGLVDWVPWHDLMKLFVLKVTLKNQANKNDKFICTIIQHVFFLDLTYCMIWTKFVIYERQNMYILVYWLNKLYCYIYW